MRPATNPRCGSCARLPDRDPECRNCDTPEHYASYREARRRVESNDHRPDRVAKRQGDETVALLREIRDELRTANELAKSANTAGIEAVSAALGDAARSAAQTTGPRAAY